jgi:hypothetical protein
VPLTDVLQNTVVTITRLHVILVLLAIAGAGAGTYWWKHHSPHAPLVATRPPADDELLVSTTKPEAAKAAAVSKDDAQQTITMVETAYEPLRARHGTIRSIFQPLELARRLLKEGLYDQSRATALDAWSAVQDFQKGLSNAGTYEVARGDSLWTIARDHSPVRQGPAWVTLWRANKTQIPDFNRIEVGWRLTIPSEPRQYVTRFWTPRMLVGSQTTPTARRGAEVDAVELERWVAVDDRLLEVDPIELALYVEQQEVDPIELALWIEQRPSGVDEIDTAALEQDLAAWRARHAGVIHIVRLDNRSETLYH